MTGSERKWIHQLAGGLAYQHVFDINILRNFTTDGYYSHSWSRDLGEKQEIFPLNSEEEVIFDIKRGIAGANAWGLGSGIHLGIFSQTTLGLKLNYDHVAYDNSYSKDVTKAGIGGTITLNQLFPQNISLSLLSGFRKPFNYYSGALNWSPKRMPGFTVGVFGDHTAGKHHLASSYDLGVSLSYAFGPKPSSKNSDDVKPKDSCKSLVGSWLVEPAVYMPQVLAIADQSVVGINGAEGGQICLELIAEGPSTLVVPIPGGFVLNSCFTVDITSDPLSSVTFEFFDGSGTSLFRSGRETPGTYCISDFGVNPEEVRTLTFENSSQVFRFTGIICSQ